METEPLFVFRHAEPKLADALRSRPTVLVPGGVRTDKEYLLAVDAVQPGISPLEVMQKMAYKFVMTAAVWPLEMASTLGKVQFLPNDAFCDEMEKKEDGNLSDLSDSVDSDDPDYYNPERVREEIVRKGEKLPTDYLGYVYVRPKYQLPAEPRSSLQTFRLLVASEDEGWSSLWKGQATNFTHYMLQLLLQPSLEGLMNDRLGLYDYSIPLQHLDNVGPNLLTMVGSRLVVGVLLSPLELIRTRMVVQTKNPKNRRYYNPVDAFYQIFYAEHYGSLNSLYFSPTLFVPTALTYIVEPIVNNAGPVFIEQVLGISSSNAPLNYAVAEFMWNTMGLVITMPIETVRKRLQVQTTAGAKQLETCVSVRQNYSGTIDCLCRIITEEGGVRTKKGKKKRKNELMWWEKWGIQPLYRGFIVNCALNLALTAASLANLTPEKDEW